MMMVGKNRQKRFKKENQPKDERKIASRVGAIESLRRAQAGETSSISEKSGLSGIHFRV